MKIKKKIDEKDIIMSGIAGPTIKKRGINNNKNEKIFLVISI